MEGSDVAASLRQLHRLGVLPLVPLEDDTVMVRNAAGAAWKRLEVSGFDCPMLWREEARAPRWSMQGIWQLQRVSHAAVVFCVPLDGAFHDVAVHTVAESLDDAVGSLERTFEILDPVRDALGRAVVDSNLEGVGVHLEDG